MKRGSVDWTVGKLLTIVLVVILLIVVVFGWSSAVVPLIERTNSSFNEVKIFFLNLFGKGSVADVECLGTEKVEIDGVGWGNLKVCRGYCEVELDWNSLFFDSNRFRLKGDEIDSFNKDRWVSRRRLIMDDMSLVEEYRDVYFEIKNELERIFGGDLKNVMEIDSEEELEFKWAERIYTGGEFWDFKYARKWDGINWKNENDKVLSSVREGLYDTLWEKYNKGIPVFLFGYIGKEKVSGLKITGMKDWNALASFIGDRKQDWDKIFSLYNEKMNEIRKLKINEKYSPDVSSAEFSDRKIVFVFIDLGYDKVGVYFKEDEFYFYSDSDKLKYDDFMKLKEGSWSDVVKLNKLYNFLKTEC